MKQELTYENAAKLVAERARQLAQDPAIQRELLKRHDNGTPIENLQKEIVNAAIYTLYMPVDKR